MLVVNRISDNKEFVVWKYINNGSEISIWCNGWYGRHVLGQDCKDLRIITSNN